MTNTKLINEAAILVSKMNEANYISETTEAIRARVENWYNHTDITDAEMLAAVALNGDFDPVLRWDDLVAAKEFYFPTIPFEYTEFHISEIESALYDNLWR